MHYDAIADRIRAEVNTLAVQPVPDDHVSIFSNGYLDSLNILNLLLFIEKEFTIHINPFDVDLDSFGSVEKMALFVQKRLQ